VFEEWQSGFEEREMECPECGQPATRLISHTSFQLKGSGWYVTDYAGKKPSGAPESGGDAKTEGAKDAGSASGRADAAPAAKKGSSDTPSAGSAS
jgi:putative FmdB family regulatory protein